MADTTGDGRADIVGFGNAGVYVSRANADGTFGRRPARRRQLRLQRRRLARRQAPAVHGRHHRRRPRRHRRLRQRRRLRLRANADGTFGAVQLVVNNFGYNAGGWRVEQHPRFLADITGDGRADIVGFGNAGV